MSEPSASPDAGTDLRHYVRWYDGALAGEFCERLVTAFGQADDRHVQRARGWRKGLEQSAWTELDITPIADESLRGFFAAQIAEYLGRYNREIGLEIAVPTPDRLAPLRMKRYHPGGDEGFQLHFDALGEVANRYLVFLWYLNDVGIGGETAFPKLGIKVSARAGRLLVFPPYWMYQHVGVPPISEDKYILSTYLLFQARPEP